MSARSFWVKAADSQNELEALLLRMRQRLYPETIPVLASYWLKTVCAADHPRGWWKELSGLLKQALSGEPLNTISREVLIEIQSWIQQSGVLSGESPGASPRRVQPFRSNLRPEWLALYIGRLLNEWLSAEVARLLVDENELAIPTDVGIPALAIGRALERILVRERLSPATLEMFLQPELLSPQNVYPADAEMLRDVVLALLGRTWAPPSPVMPATLLGVADGSFLPADFRESVRHAALVHCQDNERLHVPITAAQALEIPRSAPLKIASIIVTMDGRWWEAEKLQSGEQHAVVYRPRPGGRLRIDYSSEHAILKVPWPDTRLSWSGGVHFGDSFEIFGREWHASSWEKDEEGVWLTLVFSRVSPVAEPQPAADTIFRRSHPAAADIAWAALRDALATAIAQKSREPIEQLRRSEFIPLGRALVGLVESIKFGRLPKREAFETQLKAIRYLHTEVSVVYGRIPWGILPAPVRAALARKRVDPALVELLNQVFDALPEVLNRANRSMPEAAGSTSPSQAA